MSSGTTRRKGQSGRARTVECSACEAEVPRDKAMAKRRFGLPLNRQLIKMLRKQGRHALRKDHGLLLRLMREA